MSHSAKIENDVLHGKDGWLFLWQGGHRQFEFLTGVRKPSEDSIHNFHWNVEARVSLCERRKLRYQHVVFPSKPVVMAEYLPDSISDMSKSIFETHYQSSFGADFQGYLSYPKELLLAEKSSSQVFRKYDTHLTSYGALLVSRDILRRFGYDHDPADHMTSRMEPAERDLANMLELNVREQELSHATADGSEAIFDNRKFTPSNGGNICIIYNPKSSSGKRLLALGDSFLKNSLLSLSTFYRDILYVRSDVFQPDLLGHFVPDDVVSANAERYLASVRSDRVASSIVMQGYGRPDYNPSREFVEALQAQLARGPYAKQYQNWAKKYS